MKKFLLVLVLAVGAISFASAQPRAIGGRLGYGIAVSYQHSLGQNMVNLDVDFPGFYGIGAAATYDWIFPITSWQEKGSWNWYAGVGAGLAFNFRNYMSVGVAGRIGVEYNFWFPMQLSLDWRPVVGPRFWFDHNNGNHNGVGFHYGGLYDGIALGIRYNF